MDLSCSRVMLAADAPAQPVQQPPPWTNMVIMVPLLIIFYFILIRPQQKKAKEHQALVKTVKPGDKVVTSGGILGVIITVKEKTVTIRSADTKLEVTKTAIGEITERSGESKES